MQAQGQTLLKERDLYKPYLPENTKKAQHLRKGMPKGTHGYMQGYGHIFSTAHMMIPTKSSFLLAINFFSAC